MSVLVKRDAPRLLRDELNDAKWTGESICLSGVTDCYQPAESHFRLTHALMEVMNERSRRNMNFNATCRLNAPTSFAHRARPTRKGDCFERKRCCE
jgi:hypothetical protein